MTVKHGLLHKGGSRLRVFEKRNMRRIFVPWGMRMGRRLHSDEFHSLYRSPNIVRTKFEMGRSCSQNGGR